MVANETDDDDEDVASLHAGVQSHLTSAVQLSIFYMVRALIYC